MLVLTPTIQSRLVGIINGLTGDWNLREDLMQEAMVHIWKAELERPDQSLSWYLQGCSFHLRHYLASGRSVDSCKRRTLRSDLPQAEDFCSCAPWRQVDNSGTVQVEAREIISLLPRFLTCRERAVFQCLLDGLQTQEIARRLHISHPTVAKDRRRIARLADRLSTWCSLGGHESFASNSSTQSIFDHASHVLATGPRIPLSESRRDARNEIERPSVSPHPADFGSSPIKQNRPRRINSSRRWEVQAA